MPESGNEYRFNVVGPDRDVEVGLRLAGGVEYVELVCRSWFSFLRGASHPEELVDRAVELGLSGLAITDRNSLAGVVRMHVAAKERGLPLLIGAEVVPVDGPAVALYAMDRAGYGRLCRLLTRGKLRMPKGRCEIRVEDIAEFSEGLVGVVLGEGGRHEGTKARRHGGDDGADCDSKRGGETGVALMRYREVFGDRVYLGASGVYGGDDAGCLARMAALSHASGVPMVAVNDVHYHEPGRRFLQDVMVCIREHRTLEQAGRLLFANAERYLKSPQQMAELFADYPEAIARTVEVARRCSFSLDELRYEYPEELCPAGLTPGEHLRRLTWAGAKGRYPGGLPGKVRRLIEHELRLIEQLEYEPYFLTVWDIVRFARSRDILCQGRGSAANSAVCYCLGITAVDPERVDLLFERFVSQERNEPPDIDVDFEHERREEVFEYIYNKYGRERAGIVAEVITYRPKSAVRDVGKALGLSLDRVDVLAKSLDWWNDQPVPPERLREAGIDPDERSMRCLRGLVKQILGIGRHLSQHVGGFVITRTPLCEMVPLDNGGMPGRTFIEWDKDDIDALGILKVDCLSLGMITAIRKCFGLINSERGARNAELALHTVPAEDPAVYDMICSADTVGVFQIESRAQMSMLPRLRPRCYYDLVIEVAIVRPGPIQGQMVHPYLRRRNGQEAVTYPTPRIKDVLEKTLGVPLFQEQAMQLAVVAAGFTPGEADQLRRSMGAWRHSGVMEKFRERLVEGMLERGLDRDFAERVFEQIRGFGAYGFPESHAASFALLVYVSAWLKRYHPAAYCAALLNSQPMGFYQPAQLVRDAVEHGVEVRGVDVNYSSYDCTLEGRELGTRNSERGIEQQSRKSKIESRKPEGERQDSGLGGVGAETWGVGGPVLRLGMRLIRGVSAAKVASIERARCEGGAFETVAELARRSGAPPAVLARLAAADAFGSMRLSRREALWQVLALDGGGDGGPGSLLYGLERAEHRPRLPAESLKERLVQDYEWIGLSLAAHPMSLVRERLEGAGAIDAKMLKEMPPGRRVRVAGLVLVRQRPATAKGLMFYTLEDETGVMNLVVRPEVYERYRRAAHHSVGVLAEGTVERQGEVVHVQTRRIVDLTEALEGLVVRRRDFR